MSVICPTVTAEDSHLYRQQLERVQKLAGRIHLDFMDGLFTSNKSIDLARAWMPEGKQVDLHLMYMRPDLYVEKIKEFAPSLVIVHAEAKGEYEPFAKSMHDAGIKVGVCLLQDTPVSIIADHLDRIDHVLIFSGDMGHFGGKVDLSLLSKVKELKRLKPGLEIGWDGGVSDKNVQDLVAGGVDVLNVGGFIQRAEDPRQNYETLVSKVS
ncbi:MAG: hypothetical protein U5L95_03400 [Candidatus Saccharibacteria bacterium]|nr:hypothetical protein [Candidatus Saccharibacteria bacterium]